MLYAMLRILVYCKIAVDAGLLLFAWEYILPVAMSPLTMWWDKD